MASSGLGFGTQSFGHFPFGSSDWAEQVLWKTLPEFYRVEDTRAPGKVADPLRKLINSIKPSFEDLRRDIDAFPSLRNADTCPTSQLNALAKTIGLVPSTDKAETFRRSEILNANQAYLHKGTDLGYAVAAGFEDLMVTVTGLWAETCSSSTLTASDPTKFAANFDDVPADSIHLDTIYTDNLAAWPWELHPVAEGGGFGDGRCRSHKLDLYFTKVDDTEIEDYADVSARAVAFSTRMKPTHVEFRNVTFDGPKAAASWTAPITSDAFASASWTAPITTGYGAPASWTATINATLTP